MQLFKILAILAIAISANAEAGNINTNNAIVARSSFHKTGRGAPIPAACCFGRRPGLEGAPDRRGLGLALHLAVDACVPPRLARVPGHVDHGLLLKDVALSVAFARHGLEGSHQVPGKTQDKGDALAMWQLLPGLSAGVASHVLPLSSSPILSKVSAKGCGYPSSTAPFLVAILIWILSRKTGPLL
ncbi:hypothetical protein MCOR02_003418 [Pyricularia oryzae]|nr:hypothetical protein MCOR02_003418 [Pyricularia oryzae]